MTTQTATTKAAESAMSIAQAKFLSELIAKAHDSAFENVQVDVETTGTKIILPQGMTNAEGIKALERKEKEEQTVVAIFEEVIAYPVEGAYALMQVLKEKFGWAHAVPTPGFFGDNPPTMVTLEIGFEEYTQVIWGGFSVPGIEGNLQTGVTNKNGRPIFVINGKVRQRHQKAVQEIADRVRVYVKERSIYRGKPIRLSADESGGFDLNDAPKFLDVSKVNENELTFSEETARQVQTNLFTPIEHTDACRAAGIPLKRGVLLEGQYGTGKTLTAYVTAKKCQANGWTFIYLDNVLGLKSAINFARQYAPAVIFAEDIDRAVSGDRSVKIDDILNNIDGVDSKNQELITILTTNYVEKIEKAMLRPGRLDAVISVTPPDAKAAEKLVRIYSCGKVPENEDLTEVGKELADQIPAVIREVVERAKLYAISLAPDSPLVLRGPAFADASRSMKRHLELMQPPTAAVLSTNEKLGASMSEVLRATINGTTEKVAFVEMAVKALAEEAGVDLN